MSLPVAGSDEIIIASLKMTLCLDRFRLETNLEIVRAVFLQRDTVFLVPYAPHTQLK